MRSGLFSKIKIFPIKLDGRFPLCGNTLILPAFFVSLLLAGPALAVLYLPERPGLGPLRTLPLPRHGCASHLEVTALSSQPQLKPASDSRLSIPCVSDISMKHSLSSYSRQKPGNCVCHSVTHSPLGVLEPIHKYAPRPVSHLLH